MRSLSDPEVLDVALDSARAVLGSPRFDADAIERTRQQMQVGLRRALQSPGSVAQRRFYRTLCAGHPYAHPPGGEEASLAAISRDDLQRFHAQYYVSANAIVAIVGAVDRAAAEQIAERVTGGLAVGEHAPPPPAVPTASGAELRESFPSSQTHIYVGQAGMARHDPDYYPLYVGNQCSAVAVWCRRRRRSARETRPVLLGVQLLQLMRVDGPFLMVAQTKNEQADDALQVMLDKNRFVEQGPDEQELEDAKQNLIGGFPLRISSNGKIVQYLAMMGFYDYPLDHLDTLPGKLAAVTVEQVRDAFSRRIIGAAGISVIVGGSAGGDSSG